MAGYTSFWNCERCGNREESIDYPLVRVCGKCIGVDIVITRQIDSFYNVLHSAAERAYTRGFKHGKEVGARGTDE